MMFNNEIIDNEEKILSKHIFLLFDNSILQKEKEKEEESILETKRIS